MDSLPSPPASSSSGKHPWMVKKHQPSTAPTLSASKLERFITFLLAAWATLASASSPASSSLSLSNNSSPQSPPPSSPSVNNRPTNAVATRSLLPTMARQCLDLVMFTSAMIITLFSYFSGDLDTKRPSTPPHHHHHSTASSIMKAPSRPTSSSLAIIPPPSKHTIMDIKELRKWQQQSQHGPSAPLLIDRQLEYVTATHPMDDQKHQRIMAWASSQGHSASSGLTQVRTIGDQLTTSSLQQSQHHLQHQQQQQQYAHSVMEEADDDEKYTFDERWSADGNGGEHAPSYQQYLYQQHHASSKMQQQQRHTPSSEASATSGKDSAPPQEEDRRLAVMEVQVASLIQQGQAALTKKIQVHERHPNEIALRRAMKQRSQQKQ